MKENFRSWLESYGLARYADVLAEQAIDLDVVQDLTEGDLVNLGLPLGDRKRLLKAVVDLRKAPSNPPQHRGAMAERRQVTILFADLVGSTNHANRLDPEDMATLLRTYQNASEAAVIESGGMITNFLGDGIVACFGYPVAHEDDAERAVMAALEITKRTSELTSSDGHILSARVGVATGIVVVGDLVSQDSQWEQALVGQAPNLAARLQALAEPGGIVIGQTTENLTRGYFHTKDLGSQILKGFDEPIQAFEVDARREVTSRFEATHTESNLSPLVGRGEELDRVRLAWKTARGGAGQILEIVGEPGIGKSRLVVSILEELQDRTGLIRYFCSDRYRNSAFYPVIEQLRAAAHIDHADSNTLKLDKLEEMMVDRGQEAIETLALFATMLSLPMDDRVPPEQASKVFSKSQTIEAMRGYLKELAARGPLVIVAEDLHWIDPSTLDLVTQLLPAILDLPILLVMTYRPEFESPWEENEQIRTLSLNRLEPEGGAEIVLALTGQKSLPEEVMEQILARCEGVPLFIEELTKAVLSSGELVETAEGYRLDGTLPSILSMPSTLGASLMSRLDRMYDAREIAHAASVIGREFPIALLNAMVDLPPGEFGNALDRLAEAEIIVPLRHGRKDAFAFKHVLIQEVAYGNLLRENRQVLHQKVAEVLERDFTERAETEPEVLAQHFSRAGDDARAVSYLQRAGERALGFSAQEEAIAHLNLGLELCKGLTEGLDRDKAELTLLMTLGTAMVVGRGYKSPEVADTYARAHAVYPRVADDPSFSHVPIVGLYAYYHAGGEFEKALGLAESLLSLGSANDDATLVLDASSAMGLTLYTVGRYTEALDYLDNDLSEFPARADATSTYLIGVEPGVALRAFSAPVRWSLGMAKSAEETADFAIERARTLEHPFSLALALCWAAVTSQLDNNVERTAQMAREGSEIAQEKGFAYWATLATFWDGWSRSRTGEVDTGAEMISGALDGFLGMGVRQCTTWCYGLLADVEMIRGHREAAHKNIEEGLRIAKEIDEHFYHAELLRMQGLLRLGDGASSAKAAEESLNASLEIARAQSTLSWQLRTALSLSDHWEKTGRAEEIPGLLKPIIGNINEGHETADIVLARAHLAKFE